jgi:hypothetical protein
MAGETLDLRSSLTDRRNGRKGVIQGLFGKGPCEERTTPGFFITSKEAAMSKLVLFLLVLLALALIFWVMEAIHIGSQGLRIGAYSVLALVAVGLLARLAIRK